MRTSGNGMRVGLRLTAASLAVGLATVSVAMLPAAVASAASFTVSNCHPSGPGSLAAEVAAATAGATVTFAPAVSACSPIVLTSTITLTEKLTIVGPGPGSVAVSGGGAVTVFAVDSGVTAVISGLTIEDGQASATPYAPQLVGGGIYNEGTLAVTECTLSDNDATAFLGLGGGIFNDVGAMLAVTDSTLSDNSVTGAGGGIFNNFGTANVTDSTLSSNIGGGILTAGTMTVTNSTLSDNSASAGGGGIDNVIGTMNLTNSTLSDNASDLGGGIANFATATVTNSTLSDNSGSLGGAIFNASALNIGATIVADTTSGGDCYDGGSLTDLGYNMDDDGSFGFSGTSTSDSLTIDASLGSLANNGGPTQTIGLSGGPAVDVVPAAQCPATDQRGAPRTALCDIGAYDTDFPNFSAVCATGIPHYLWATSSAGDFEGLFCVNTQGNGSYIQSNGSTGTATLAVVGTITRITASGKNLQLNGSIQGTTGTVTEIAPAPRKTGTFTLT